MASSIRGTTCACVVCLAELNSSSTRRRLDTESSKHPLPLLQSLGYNGEVTKSTFLCRQCFRDTERIVRLIRDELKQLELKMTSSTLLAKPKAKQPGAAESTGKQHNFVGKLTSSWQADAYIITPNKLLYHFVLPLLYFSISHFSSNFTDLFSPVQTVQ